MDEEEREKIGRLYKSQRKRLMQAVRKPAFGQTETQVDFFEDTVHLHTHITPAWTKSEFSFPILSFCVRHNPFISYSELDEILEYALIQEAEMEQAERDSENAANEGPAINRRRKK